MPRLGKVSLEARKQQCQSQRAMDKEIPIAFHLLGIRFVEVNQMGIESESGKSK